MTIVNKKTENLGCNFSINQYNAHHYIVNGDSIGPLAMINYQSGQVRKEAAIVVNSCAGVWLVE